MQCLPPYYSPSCSWPAFTSLFAATVFAVCCTCTLSAQVSFDQPPIDYLNGTPNDAISKLQQKINTGEIKLRFESERGYLNDVLEHLDISETTQTLVFSKTSFQLRRISPQTPRALYFNDGVYVGWVKNGDVMEISAVDPNLGTNFYTLSQRDIGRPKFQRHTHECLQCHGSTLTRGVPGHLVRSVYPDADGHPILSSRTFHTDQTSPFPQRWGGWYVTGTHGAQRHLGNLFVRDGVSPEKADTDSGANQLSLAKFFDTTAYLTEHSDIVALMVLEHQTTMHNLITRANFVTRIALRDQKVINEMLDRPLEYRSETTNRRIQSVVDPLVAYMLFSGETPLTDEIKGNSEFTSYFSAVGLCDQQGRSLREFDLRRRLFKYPCSFLVYSNAFDALPELVMEQVYRRLWDVLTQKDTSPEFSHLSASDRNAILEILRDTKSNLPDYWRQT